MPRDGVQLYWFTQLAAREGKTLDQTLPQVLQTVAEAGFSSIEADLAFCGTDESTEAFAGKLKAAGLGLAGLYAGGAMHDATAKATVAGILGLAARGKAIGCPGISHNPNPIGREKTDAELATQAAALNDLGAGLADLGLFLGVHTHAPEMSHNAREFRANLDLTDPTKVGLCADFHWVYRGGGDPYALTEHYVKRIVTTHLRNSVHGVWAESFSDGDLDYRKIAAILANAKYAGPLVVEIAWEERTPNTRTPVENLKLSRAFLREVFGV
jgi:inosose dehydratase